MKRIPVERFWLDHLLATAAGVMAVFSVGRSVGDGNLPLVLAAAVFLAGLTGFGLSLIVEDTPFQKADAWLFAIGAIVGVLQTRTVNGMLPEEGFPFAIIAATMMFILLVVGGVFSWSDPTLLFTSLPSLVVFGLVGTIDSWRPGLFLFCGLILCIALLYARVHQRTMVRWAEEGGADRRTLNRDAWRWVAGPEYAFAAAGTIILLSFVGAPVVQTSLSGVSDAVRVNVRQQIPTNPNRSQASNSQKSDSPIGTGPVELSDKEIARVSMPRPLYLRKSTYIQYSGRGWNTGSQSGNKPYAFEPGGKTLPYRRTSPLSLEDSAKTEEIPYRYLGKSWIGAVVPTPGQVVEVKSNQGNPTETPAGSYVLQTDSAASNLDAVVRVPKEIAVDSQARFPGLNPDDPSVRGYYALPQRAGWDSNPALARVDLSDYERLALLARSIGGSCKYNTQTPPVPQGKDPVDYFLNTSKVGYCDLFASSFALEARRMGFPSRYVTGYIVESGQLQKDGTYLIQEKHSHAWAEVYFEGFGWIPFDATSGAEDITPKDSSDPGAGLFQKIRAWAIKNMAGILAALAVGLIASVYLLAKSRGVALLGADANRPLRLAANRFQMGMERLAGTPRRFSQTLREFAEIHADALHPVKTEVEGLLTVIESAMFGPVAPDAETMAAISKQAVAFDQETRRIAKARRKP
ncbi:MAG: transglutaminase domain-containing protein [Armatimonadetes bacterium]|nr:transglutaminase domain-containing protein [Armatimonadota bacterium]